MQWNGLVQMETFMSAAFKKNGTATKKDKDWPKKKDQAFTHKDEIHEQGSHHEHTREKEITGHERQRICTREQPCLILENKALLLQRSFERDMNEIFHQCYSFKCWTLVLIPVKCCRKPTKEMIKKIPLDSINCKIFEIIMWAWSAMERSKIQIPRG